jgi:hypothetical protein
LITEPSGSIPTGIADPINDLSHILDSSLATMVNKSGQIRENHRVVEAYLGKEMMPHSFSPPAKPIHLSFTAL